MYVYKLVVLDVLDLEEVKALLFVEQFLYLCVPLVVVEVEFDVVGEEDGYFVVEKILD